MRNAHCTGHVTRCGEAGDRSIGIKMAPSRTWAERERRQRVGRASKVARTTGIHLNAALPRPYRR